MVTYTQYLIPCITEEKCVYSGYVDSVPTTCPNDTSHTIDPDGIIIAKTLAEKTVVVNQATDTTIGGFYRNDYFSFEARAKTDTIYDISYPYNINILLATYIITEENIGDTLNMCAVPDVICGTTSKEIKEGDTTLIISSSHAQLNPGFNLKITNEDYTEDLGEIKSFDTKSGVITFTNPIIRSFPEKSVLKMTIYRVKNLKIVNTNNVVIGKKKLNGVGLPANKIMRLIYTNNDERDKFFNFSLEFGY